MDGHNYDISHSLFYNLFPDNRKRVEKGKLDNIFLGNVEHHVDVSRITQFSRVFNENFYVFWNNQLTPSSEEYVPELIS